MSATAEVTNVTGVGWPLSEAQRAQVLQLSELVRRFGAARLTETHLVRADERDFPDPWEPTLASLYRLVYRLFWHAHIDHEIVIEDLRQGAESDRMLSNSTIDFIDAADGRASFQLAGFGNDDIAGLLSHAVGEAFLALAPVDPFRPLPTTAPTTTEASIAACYLGLGVLVANASMYRRYQSRLVGREVMSEQRVETTGGLSIGDATLLLAVQLTVRDDVPGAVGTLHGPQKEWIERWLAVLDPHEDELRALLGLDEADTAALPTRGAEPRQPPAVAEPALAKRFEGLLSFRVPRRRHRMWIGLALAFLDATACRIAFGENPYLLLLFPIGAIAGYLVGRPGFACHACSQTLPSELPVCPNCHVTLEDTLVTRAEQKARLAEFAARAEEVDPEHAEQAERAYHPDV